MFSSKNEIIILKVFDDISCDTFIIGPGKRKTINRKILDQLLLDDGTKSTITSIPLHNQKNRLILEQAGIIEAGKQQLTNKAYLLISSQGKSTYGQMDLFTLKSLMSKLEYSTSDFKSTI